MATVTAPDGVFALLSILSLLYSQKSKVERCSKSQVQHLCRGEINVFSIVYSGMGGSYTKVNSAIRRLAPENINGRKLIKVVYLVLEAQYQSSLTSAVKKLNEDNKEICFELSGYLPKLPWWWDDRKLAWDRGTT